MWFVVIGLVILAVSLIIIIRQYTKDPIPNRELRLQENKYSTKMNRFAARGETKAAKARTDTADAVTLEMYAATRMNAAQLDAEASVYRQEHHQEFLHADYQVELSNHYRLLEENELTRKLIGTASQHQLDLPTYLELKKKIEMDRHDLDKQWREAEQQLKAGFIYQLQAHQHLALMTEYIGKLYDRAKELEAAGKDREHKLIEEHIAFMEGDFRGRQRLLQASQQENLQGGDEDTDPERDGSEAIQTTQE